MSIRKIIEGVSKKKTNEMYENYGFVLEWEELPEELQQEKIVAYAKYNKSEYENADTMGDEEIIEKWGDTITSNLSSYFPMYF